jgi:hypothetical protein
VADLPDPQREDDEPGSTFVLTGEGWEVAEYVAPEDDWVVREDGSFESPDGTMRTWTPADPAGG